ncbi:MAG: TIR domain-containing protein [Mesorhizobium sp.]
MLFTISAMAYADGIRGRERSVKIFLGYGSEHGDAAREVYTYLKTLVDDVWFDQVSLVGATDWDRARSIGQDSADMMIHLCSAEMLKRKGVVHREIRQTLRLAEDQPFGANFVLFIRLTDVRLPVEYTRYQYIDFFSSDWQERLNRAVSARQAQIEEKGLNVSVENKMSLSNIQGNEQITVEKITDSYESRGSLIVYPERDAYWKYINSSIAAKVLDSHFSSGREFPDIKSLMMPEVKSESSTTTEEFFRNSDIVSIRFHHNYYHSGAAHGNHGVSTMNFLGPKLGKVPVGYLFSYDYDVAKRIMDHCEKVIIATFDGEIEKSDLYFGNGRDDAQLWELIDKYNIDGSGITINFSPYEILPFAFGSHEVLVPWRMIAGDLVESVAELPRWVAQ